MRLSRAVWLWRKLAQKYPDPPLARLMASQTRLINVAGQLVRQHRAKVAAEASGEDSPSNPSSAAGGSRAWGVGCRV